jgi:GxxExxY protein
MHLLFKKADELSRVAIGAAIEVHRLKGPGLIEIYERCLMHELALRQITTANQRLVRIEYKGLEFDEPLRFDVLVEDCLLLGRASTRKRAPVLAFLGRLLHTKCRTDAVRVKGPVGAR